MNDAISTKEDINSMLLDFENIAQEFSSAIEQEIEVISNINPNSD